MLKNEHTQKALKSSKINRIKTIASPPSRQINKNILYEKLYKRNSVTLANSTKLIYLQIQGRIQMYSYEYLGKVPTPFSMC